MRDKCISERIVGLGASTDVSFAPGGALCVTSLTGEVQVWNRKEAGNRDCDEWRLTYIGKIGSDLLWCSRLTADGQNLVTSRSNSSQQFSRFEVWDTATWEKVDEFASRVAGHFSEIDVINDRWVLLGSDQGHLSLLDLANREIAATRKVHHGPIFGGPFR